MQFFYDAVLPQSLSAESPPGVIFHRWDGSDISDKEFVRESAKRGCRGVIFWGRDSLQQADRRNTAQETGVALVAVEADSPVSAKHRILKNLSGLQRKLNDHNCLLILANEVRPVEDKNA